MKKPAERWLPIPDLEFYEVSNLGRVRSVDRTLALVGRWGPMMRFHRGKVLRLKPKPNGDGGIYWSFYAGLDGGYHQVNRVVCRTFNDKPPSPKHEAAHLDGDTHNNCPENLIWATPVENARHKVAHGTHSIGSNNSMARLRESDVKGIFESYCQGIGPDIVAREFGTSRGNVIAIVSGRAWDHVDVGTLRAEARLRARSNLQKSWIDAAARRAERGPSLVIQQ